MNGVCNQKCLTEQRLQNCHQDHQGLVLEATHLCQDTRYGVAKLLRSHTSSCTLNKLNAKAALRVCEGSCA